MREYTFSASVVLVVVIIAVGLLIAHGSALFRPSVPAMGPQASMSTATNTPARITANVKESVRVQDDDQMARSQLRVVSWNIRHGVDGSGGVNLGGVVERLQMLDADIVGLQEVDRLKSRSGFRDQALTLARQLRYEYAFGVNLRVGVGQYGNALLSRWPIIESSNHRLPGRGEPRGVLWALVKTPDGPLNVLVTHLGLNWPDREQQLAELQRIIDGLAGPAVVIGDFNAHDEAAFVGLTELVCSGGTGTYPAANPTACIDKIFVSASLQSDSARAIADETSDHRPVMADISGITVAEGPYD